MLSFCSFLDVPFQILLEFFSSLIRINALILLSKVSPNFLSNGHLHCEIIDCVSVHVPFPIVDLRKLVDSEHPHFENKAHQNTNCANQSRLYSFVF